MGKRHIPTTILLIALALVWTLGAVSTVAASEITDDLKGTIDNVLKIVTDESLKERKVERRARIRETIDKRFNYEQMVMRSLAKNWDERTPEEKAKFTDLFRRLLENSYASKIESYRDEKIEYVDEAVKGDYAMVKTKIQRKDASIDVDYKLIKENGEWRVYDFIIERVSMIRNYRSQFSKIILKESYQGLVAKLESKIKELELNDKSNADSL
ncbi:MAG: toluene tolerance protein [Nitrospinae bacterium CG11_big_fil_rev_8_21_14_0_20_56_8]|nr:MAG: toluene tolerance protein [Nitrospinae bacterium CG11_big_fil_rev_8_21_14_0_20_56_8]